MLIGVPRETKIHEYCVGLIPASVRELSHHGHAVLIEAGAAINYPDAMYSAVVADVLDLAWQRAEDAIAG
jgi:alanine dehydrogenase